MPFFLRVISGIQTIIGIVIFANAQSAIHQILGTLMVGFAILTFALAAILEAIKTLRQKKPVTTDTK